jgi:8-oxo-dGTP pyrophosphatase MutT (NUDIX family)
VFSLKEICDTLGARPVSLAGRGERRRAAVALVVCDARSGPEVLFIERTEHDRDPWSGHLAFPGGRVDPTDQGPRQAAERETLEEVGVDLARAAYLGRLDDLRGAHLPVVVSCFVFGVRHRPELRLDPREVADAFWFPLEGLLDPRRRREETFRFRGEDRTYPALQLLGEGRPVLWGITYRLTLSFLEAMGRSP